MHLENKKKKHGRKGQVKKIYKITYTMKIHDFF